MKKLFYQNYREKNGSFTGALDPKIFSALTLHPVKDARQMYRLYVLLKTKQLQLVQLHQQTLLTTLNGFEEIAERIVVRKHVEHTRHDGKRSDAHLPFSHGKDVKGSDKRKDALLGLGSSDISDFTNSQRRLLHVEENNSRENRSVGLRRSDLRRRPQGQRTPSAQAIRSESDRSRIVREAREEIRQLELRTPAKDLIQSPRTTRRDQNVTQARTGGRDSDSVREKPERESPHTSSGESLPGSLAPSASKAGHSVTSPETFFKASKPLLDSETTTRSFTVQAGPTKESTTPTSSFLQKQSSVTLHVNSSVTRTVYKNVKLKQNPLAAASEELVWDFVGPGNTFFSVSSLVHPALRMASQRASKHLSNFQKSLPTTKEAPGRIVGQYQSMSISRGLHHILVTSADNKTRSFLLTTRFEPLQLREVEDVEDISTQSKVGLGSNKLQVTEIRHQDVVSQHSLKSGKDMANGTSHPAGVLLGERQRQSHSDLWILLPLYGRYKAYARFLQYLSASVRSYPGEVHLRVALFPDPWRNHEKSWTSTEQHRQVSKNNSSAQNLDITLVTMNVTFSRARALHDLASEMDEQALLVLMDVDLVLTTNFLFRVARNAGPGRAYFPAYFAQYNPETVCYGEAPNCTRDWSDFSRDSGTWRYFSYGVAALTAGDLRRAGGLDTTIKGWGKEDVDLYSKCVTKGLHIMRALDPGLLHVHHRRSCDPTLAPDQLRMCRSSFAALYGSIHKLAAMVMDNETD
ncbi:hypothetical protein BaRGS_00014653 [Batillaria attramentaria]|uniref:Hexosyltransferase n=1 Tax=Batillaria attramentaria TaxID=370345 RepID=A0ABD0L3Y6_9CAEN